MEPIVVFSVGLVLYCGYLTIVDILGDRVRCRVKRGGKLAAKAGRKRKGALIVSSDSDRADGGGGHWPALLKGSA